jgi:hypothetical protein
MTRVQTMPIPNTRIGKTALLTLVAILYAAQTGCATYVAVTMPGPADDELIEPGMSRNEVETLLETGPESDYSSGDITTVRYEYSDGPHQASKVRALVYIAGDVFTLFLTEIVFWPIELYASSEIERVATAEYDDEFILHEWRVTERDGDLVEVSYLDENGRVIPVVAREDDEEEAQEKLQIYILERDAPMDPEPMDTTWDEQMGAVTPPVSSPVALEN